ncbi:MAG: taurine dioxygenase [Gammaproteobacteria bacterium]|nr:taurine dioxygenase [Gammaproteobacteria bacterium]
MKIDVKALEAPCGAIVKGVEIKAGLSDRQAKTLRQAWLKHHVLVFPEQKMSDDDLEKFSLCFGEFGKDPYIEPIAGRKHVCAIKRLAEEKSPIFAESWHTDWSFLEVPPAGTCLYGKTIPPIGGETSFANQHAAYRELPKTLKTYIDGKWAIHSAAAGYSPEGIFGVKGSEKDRSMKILVSEGARKTQKHLLVRKHPENGRKGIFSCFGYITGIDGMPEDEAKDLLLELYRWQTKAEFIYQHVWEEDMLVMWDNRSLLHRANAGYEGFDRLLHRTTIAELQTNEPHY